jgi:hypothetical protein
MRSWWFGGGRNQPDGRDGSPLRAAAHVAAATRDGCTVLLDLRTERYLRLDEVGGAVWAQLEHGASVPEVVDRLAAEYDAPVDRIRADVEAFVTRLGEARLVERS